MIKIDKKSQAVIENLADSLCMNFASRYSTTDYDNIHRNFLNILKKTYRIGFRDGYEIGKDDGFEEGIEGTAILQPSGD